MPSRNTGSTSSRYILRSAASVSPQSWPDRIRQTLSEGMTLMRAPSLTAVIVPDGAISLVWELGMRSRMPPQ